MDDTVGVGVDNVVWLGTMCNEVHDLNLVAELLNLIISICVISISDVGQFHEKTLSVKILNACNTFSSWNQDTFRSVKATLKILTIRTNIISISHVYWMTMIHKNFVFGISQT